MKATAERILSPLAIPSGSLLSTLPLSLPLLFSCDHADESHLIKLKIDIGKSKGKETFIWIYILIWLAMCLNEKQMPVHKRQEAQNCSPLQQPACTFSIASSRLCVCSWDQMRQITQKKVFLPTTYKEKRKRKKIPLMEEHWAVQLWIRPSWCPMGTCQLAGELPQMERADLLAASPSLLRILTCTPLTYWLISTEFVPGIFIPFTK